MRRSLSSLPLLTALSLSGSFVTARAVAQDPTASLKQADADYREGVAALYRNDLVTAQAKFESVVHLAPSAEQGHSALGAVLVREARWDAGIRELQKALALKPDDTSAQINLALAYEQTGASAKSLPLFARAESAAKAENHSLPANVLAAYAGALTTAGHPASAIAHMKEAIAQDPRNAELHDNLGSIYAQQQDWDHAAQEFSAAVRLKPDYATAHLHLGSALQAEQKPDAAAEWTQAYHLAPNDPGIALAVGKALAGAGQDDAAVPILEHAAQVDPTPEANYQLAVVLQRVNRLQDAIRLLKSVVDAEPRNAQALVNLGLALSQAHQATEAVPYLQRALALQPVNATAHQDLAAAYVQISQIADAVVQLHAAIRLAPDSPQTHYDLGVAYKLQDDPVKAIPELEKAEQLDASAYEPKYVLGLMYMQVARYGDAAAQLETSLKLHPDNGDGWATLGSVYNKLDRLADSVFALKEAVRQLPDQADPHLSLAAVLVKQNQPAEAAEERKIAANLMRAHMNLQRAEVATNSGKSLMEKGKTDDAISQFREAITLDPRFAEAHLELAKALEKQGKTADAAAERERANTPATPLP